MNHLPGNGQHGRRCHYCDTLNEPARETCARCGMALPPPGHDPRRRALRRFVVLFVAVVLFCAAMIWYLPR